MDKLRLFEAATQALLLLGSVALPAAWRAFDPSIGAVLSVMFVLITAGTYALHAVTFDCFRLTGHRQRGKFPYTQRKD
jgi:hypothetical protein